MCTNEEELAKLGLEPTSSVSNFWNKVAERKSTAHPQMAKVCSQIATVVEEDFCAETIEEMRGMLTVEQLQQIMSQSGGKSTWSAMITKIVGDFKPSAPPAMVPFTAASFNTDVKREATFPILALGAAMESAGSMDKGIIPEYVFKAYSECEDPRSQQLTAIDLTDVMNAYTHYMIMEHGQPAGDKALRKHHARQLKMRLPNLPDHGKHLGRGRKWLDVLEQRKRNLARTRGTTDC